MLVKLGRFATQILLQNVQFFKELEIFFSRRLNARRAKANGNIEKASRCFLVFFLLDQYSQVSLEIHTIVKVGNLTSKTLSVFYLKGCSLKNSQFIVQILPFFSFAMIYNVSVISSNVTRTRAILRKPHLNVDSNLYRIIQNFCRLSVTLLKHKKTGTINVS